MKLKIRNWYSKNDLKFNASGIYDFMLGRNNMYLHVPTNKNTLFIYAR